LSLAMNAEAHKVVTCSTVLCYYAYYICVCMDVSHDQAYLTYKLQFNDSSNGRMANLVYDAIACALKLPMELVDYLICGLW